MKISTEFWEQFEKGNYTEKLSQLIYVFTIFFAINVIQGLITKNKPIIILNILPLLFGMIIQISYNQYCKNKTKKELEKCADQT